MPRDRSRNLALRVGLSRSCTRWGYPVQFAIVDSLGHRLQVGARQPADEVSGVPLYLELCRTIRENPMG